MSLKPIGIFDSGVGGLTVMSAVLRLLPHESIIYLGDTARVPYGTKSADTILRYTEECCTFLAKKDVKAIVIACNSASAHAFPYLTHKFEIPLLGVIEAGVAQALKTSRNKNIGVIGTQATIESDIYAKELKRLDSSTTITSLACPLFVPLVEENWIDHPVTTQIAQHYLETLSQDGMDTLILACTHYPLLKDVIRKVLRHDVSLIDSADAVALKLENLLKQKNLLRADGTISTQQIYVTDLPARFEATAKRFLGEAIQTIKRVTL